MAGALAVADTKLAETPPSDSRLTPYDHAHRITYLRLLAAAAEQADWREVATVVRGIDPAKEPERARRVHDAHLARARWMTEHGYRDLLQRGLPESQKGCTS